MSASLSFRVFLSCGRKAEIFFTNCDNHARSSGGRGVSKQENTFPLNKKGVIENKSFLSLP